MWSPREQHAVAVLGNYLYVSGGFSTISTLMCGPFNCGGGYRDYLQVLLSCNYAIDYAVLL